MQRTWLHVPQVTTFLPGRRPRMTPQVVIAVIDLCRALQGRVKLGSLLADMGRHAKLTDREFAAFEQVRDKTPARPVNFE